MSKLLECPYCHKISPYGEDEIGLSTKYPGYSADQIRYCEEKGTSNLDGYPSWTILQAENARLLKKYEESLK